MTKINYISCDGFKPVKYVTCGEYFCSINKNATKQSLFIAVRDKDKMSYIDLSDGKPYYFDNDEVVEVVDVFINVVRKGEC